MSKTSFFKQSGVTAEVSSNLTQRAIDAETAKTAAEAAQANAEIAATNAEASEAAVQAAADSASTSSSSAATSATTATTKASEASTSASNASTSASEAATSATNAATSETNAATSETSASTSATSAQSAQTAAETAKTSAETAQTAAETAKASAETAETNATSASTSASNSASTATTQAATATTKAGEAATSATNAATSETNAATSETNAATSETNAATSETNAATSETNAATSASTASTQAGIATTKAGEASTSATNAQTAQTASEDARDLALSYRNTAETHKDAAASSATNAATSETNAGTSATNAATSETNAATSATNAATSETNASTSATSAAASQVAAAASAASAANTYDLFDDRYLGVKTSDPTVDNDGDALAEGALYFNSTANEMRVYDGANWVAASSAGTASLLNYNYTATADQTTFSGSDDNANTLSYTVENIIVTLNGVVLEDGTDYTATNGTSVVLASGASLNDELNIVVFKSFTTADMVSATNGGTFQNDITINGDLTVDTGTLFVDASADTVSINGTITKTNQTSDLTIGDFGGSSHEISVASGGQLNIGTAGNNPLDFKTNNAVRATIDGSGNVGIGTSSPSTVSGFTVFEVAGSSSGGFIQATDGTVNNSFYNSGNVGYIGTQTNHSLGLVTNGAERMRITSTGVGIGTSSPDTKLHIDGGSVGSGSGEVAIKMSLSANTISARNEIRSGNTNGTNPYISFAVRETSSPFATVERMRILDDGDVAIGSTGASGKLFINQKNASSVATYNYANNGSYSGVAHRNRCSRTGSSGYYLYWGESGNGSDTEFYVRGDGIVRADGSIIGGGADYAEMFEWDDGNSSNEDRRGCSVVLTNGNKIRKATSDDAATDVIGIVSGTAMLIGDAEPMKWSGKYNRDDFGSEIWETYTLTEWAEPAVYEDVQIEAVLDEDGNEIEPAGTGQREVTEAVEHSYETDKIPSDLTVPSDATVLTQDAEGNTLKRRQLNPSYDDTQTYTPREDRQEWDAVGLMGKLRMRVGQPTGDRWIKMRDITSDIEEWLVR